jgi:hypothetical protein
MDFGNTRTYELELWSSNGHRVADISNLAKSRSFTIPRNDAQDLSFTLDLFAFEEFAANMGIPAAELLMPYQMDVLLKRNGQYLFGTQIVSCPLDISESSYIITVRCRGYFDLVKDRYISQTYVQQEATSIAGDLFTQSQAKPNGDVGITLAPGQYETGVLRDRTYTRDNVKRMIQNLTQLVDGRFDFDISYDKKFQTYAALGSNRTDLQFTFGGSASNIASLYLERSATKLYNHIDSLGSGFGPDQLISESDDAVSQINNFRRETITQHNSVTEQPTLDQHAATDLALSKDLLQIPQITITGAELRNKDFIQVGDRIPLKFVDHSYFSGNDGLYRVEKMTVSLDDNDFEKSIELYFDNFDLVVEDE